MTKLISRRACAFFIRHSAARKLTSHPGLAWFLVTALSLVLTSETSFANTLNIVLVNSEGIKVNDAVVSAKPVGSDDQVVNQFQTTDNLTTIAQADGQFTPLVTAVQAGTAIAFPNNDNVHHNVYSISRAKRFQLPLYKDNAPDPVVFDKAGSVVLGCNIHDWMVAYVRVLDTPFFGKTNTNGAVTLTDLPEGEYELEVWHPHKRRRANSTSRIQVSDQTDDPIELSITMTPQWRSITGSTSPSE